MRKTDERINEALARDFEKQQAREVKMKPAIPSSSKHEEIAVLRPAHELEFSCDGREVSGIEKQLIAFMVREQCLCHIDVDEIYSPPRVVPEAVRQGLKGGLSMDLTTCDENGVPWDFSKLEQRNKAIRR